MSKFESLKTIFTISLLILCINGSAQKDTSKYDRLEEIPCDQKRYRIHNN